MAELRERAGWRCPVAAGLGGLIVPVVIYLAFNAGGPAAHGWGAGHVHGLGVRASGRWR